MADCLLACLRRRLNRQDARRHKHPLVPGSPNKRLVNAPLRHVHPFGSPKGSGNRKQCACKGDWRLKERENDQRDQRNVPQEIRRDEVGVRHKCHERAVFAEVLLVLPVDQERERYTQEASLGRDIQGSDAVVLRRPWWWVVSYDRNAEESQRCRLGDRYFSANLAERKRKAGAIHEPLPSNVYRRIRVSLSMRVNRQDQPVRLEMELTRRIGVVSLHVFIQLGKLGLPFYDVW